jgi:RNA-directed DNA polymerase
MLGIAPTKRRALTHGAQMHWTRGETNVRRLQDRLYRAAAHHAHGRGKNLQKLLVRSMAATLTAIRQVTQEHSGTQTPGIDGVVCATPQKRWELRHDGRSLKGYRPKPVQRQSIPKPSGGQRPFGIPPQKDRGMQAMGKRALAPAGESRVAAHSYGCRPGRSTMEAITAIHTAMHRKNRSQWVLDADITGCLDNIDHTALLARRPVFTTPIRRWLNAGVGEWAHSTRTETGTPQGGVRSPLVAHVALDGMERLFDGAAPNGHPQQPSWKTGLNKGISLIRSADDVVAIASAREGLEQHVLPRLAAFLAHRGRHLSEAKTRMVHSTRGCNFLGCEIRRFRRALLTQPQKAKRIGHSRAIKTFLAQQKQSPAVQVLRDLNPHIRGWSNYSRHCAAKRACRKLDPLVWHALWRWAKRRHPNKSAPWVKQRDVRTVGNRQGVFAKEKAQMLWYQDTPITRGPKVRGKSSPMHPARTASWAQRAQWRLKVLTITPQRQSRLHAQDCRCGLCKGPFYHGDPIDDHHIKPKHQGGDERQENRRLVHRWCHHAHHQRPGDNAAGACAV